MAAPSARPVLDVIADGFTGASDVASLLVRAGMRSVQAIGVRNGAPQDADAIVVALKSRTVPAADAVRESLAALRWLQAAGARQFHFKYCSTFDSTLAGNIGPVALLDAWAATSRSPPAFPENGRTVFHGHMFVGDDLLSDSGMRNHPLAPMTESSLVKVLKAQSNGKAGLVRHHTVASGEGAVRARFTELRSQGVRLVVADAVSDEDLRTLGSACADLPLITAGSGVLLGLPAVYQRQGSIHADAQARSARSAGVGPEAGRRHGGAGRARGNRALVARLHATAGAPSTTRRSTISAETSAPFGDPKHAPICRQP